MIAHTQEYLDYLLLAVLVLGPIYLAAVAHHIGYLRGKRDGRKEQ